MTTRGPALADDLLRRYGVGRTFAPPDEEERAAGCMRDIDFHKQGHVCATTRSDGVLTLINCLSGRVVKTIFSKRYGVDLLAFTHHPDCVLFSDATNDHRIRYHSFYDNQFLRYFSGHTATVTSLRMHPTADEFMSASLDGSVRIWDLQSPEAKAVLRADHSPVHYMCGAYDDEGMVFGVSLDDSLIRMYDAQNYQDGPFAKFDLHDASITTVVEPLLARMQTADLRTKPLHAMTMHFSPDGKTLLVGTNRGVFLLLDAFEGVLLHVLNEHVADPKNETRLGASFSPDSSYVSTGSEDGRICLYKTSTGEHVHTLPQGHDGPVVGVQWNPQRHLLASIGAKTSVFWTAGRL